MKLSTTIALFVVTSIPALLVGALVATVWNSLNPHYFVVHVVDGPKCSDPEYFVELRGQTVSVKVPNADIFVMPPLDSPQQITYRIRARYSNCAEILSDQRTVERGWRLYERIDEESIHHIVRAK